MAIYRVGIDVGLFKDMPPAATSIYSGEPWSDDACRRRQPAVRREAGRRFGLSASATKASSRSSGLPWSGRSSRCFVPHFLFPSIPEIAARLLRDLQLVEIDRRRARHQRPHPRRARRRLRARHFARSADGAVGHVRALCLAAVEFQSGHSGAVLGGHRHHLVPRHRIPHLLHHGDDDAAGLHLPGARRLPHHVEGPLRDDAGVPADAGSICSAP